MDQQGFIADGEWYEWRTDDDDQPVLWMRDYVGAPWVLATDDTPSRYARWLEARKEG